MDKELLNSDGSRNYQANILLDNVKRLEQENERLKKQYNCYACDSCGGKEDYINMKRHTENAIKTIHKYKQALQEIRDMVDCANCEYESNDNCNPQQCSKIENKINEVIGAEEWLLLD